MKRTLAFLLVFVFLTGLTKEAVSQESVVFRALPTAFTSSSAEQAEHAMLTEEDRQEAQVLIVKRKGDYFWASREDRELTHVISGLFHLFIDLRGGGYVKVLDQRHVSRDALIRLPGADLQFYEHLTFGTMTIAYWGEGGRFDP